MPISVLLKWLFVIARTGDARARARRTYGDRSYSRGAADSTTNIVAGVADTRYERRTVRPCANKPYCSSYLAGRAISLSNPNADSDYYDLSSDRFPTTASRELRFFRVFSLSLSLSGLFRLECFSRFYDSDTEFTSIFGRFRLKFALRSVKLWERFLSKREREDQSSSFPLRMKSSELSRSFTLKNETEWVSRSLFWRSLSYVILNPLHSIYFRCCWM